MAVFRVAAHGFVLLVANFTGIIVGFMAYCAVRPADQIAMQLPIAILLSILLFLAWTLILRNLPFRRLSLQGYLEFIWTFGASLIWAPVVFVPLHYFTQGYLTSAGNIISVLVFQIPVNTVALVWAWRITQPRAQADAEDDAAQA